MSHRCPEPIFISRPEHALASSFSWPTVREIHRNKRKDIPAVRVGVQLGWNSRARHLRCSVSDERLATRSTAFPIVRINAIECQRTAGKIQDFDPSSRDPDPLAAWGSSSSMRNVVDETRLSRVAIHATETEGKSRARAQSRGLGSCINRQDKRARSYLNPRTFLSFLVVSCLTRQRRRRED